MNKLGLTEKEDQKIAEAYPGGDHKFYHQDLDDANVADATQWVDENKMVAIVSEIHGGIIGYIHADHADDITTILNLHVIDSVTEPIQIEDDHVTISDEHGEIAHWVSDEWEEDSTVTAAIANAINVYHTEGAKALRKRIGREINVEPKDRF